MPAAWSARAGKTSGQPAAAVVPRLRGKNVPAGLNFLLACLGGCMLNKPERIAHRAFPSACHVWSASGLWLSQTIREHCRSFHFPAPAPRQTSGNPHYPNPRRRPDPASHHCRVQSPQPAQRQVHPLTASKSLVAAARHGLRAILMGLYLTS